MSNGCEASITPQFRVDAQDPLLQPWHKLSHSQAEEAIFNSESMRFFAKVQLSFDTVPDETTISGYRHLLKTYNLAQKIVKKAGAKYILDCEETNLYGDQGHSARRIASGSKKPGFVTGPIGECLTEYHLKCKRSRWRTRVRSDHPF